MKYTLTHDWEKTLTDFLRIPTVTTEDISICTDYLVVILRGIGMEVQIEGSFGSTVILARIRGKSEKSILFYSHYDVKPPGDLSLWSTDPFEPTIIGERIYCRGSGDAKGQVFALIEGIRKAVHERETGLAMGISLILDGGEESGSIGLDKVCRRYANFLNCELAMVYDSHWIDDTPLIGMGCRGQISFVASYHAGFCSDLHAGNYGGIYKGAAYELINVLSKFFEHDYVKGLSANGAVSICGLHSGLRVLRTAQRQ